MATEVKQVPEILQTLKPGDTIYTTLKHVSQSGMTRDIKMTVIRDNEPYNITWVVADLLGHSVKNDGVRIGGCGMDMGFALVYNLGRVLFPDGFGLECEAMNGGDLHPLVGQRPPSKEHAAQWVEKGASFYGRNGDRSGWDNDGGYAFTQRWM